jgi:hypothetical protein
MDQGQATMARHVISITAIPPESKNKTAGIPPLSLPPSSKNFSAKSFSRS